MTVTIENLYTGNGSTTDYSFTFPYLDTPDIKASLAGVSTTAFTLLNATTVRFNTAPGNGVAIRIYRETAYTNPKATFYPGSAIRAGDLNDNTLQNLYVNQESNDKVADAWLTGDPTVISTEAWYTTDDTKVATTKAIENRINSQIDSALTDDVVAGSSITIADDTPSAGKITVSVNAASGSATGSMSSAHYSKLEGIEANATADQTNAEIRTAVEAASDSNVFTDADHSKLNAIEASATADQTDAEIRAAVEAASDSNVFTDADHTKLNGIEASATADQTAAEIKTSYESNAQTNPLTDAEKAVIDGVTANTSELNKLDGVTASTAQLNIVSGKTFRASGDGTLTTTSDTELPSSKVIASHVASAVSNVGGFVTIANEISFPTTANQPANGVIVSISDAAGTVVNGSGVSTTGRTTDGTPATVTINNFPSSLNSETLASGVALLVTSTGSSNTYNYHKILAAETDVKSLSDDINDFNARYRVASSAPGSNNDDGDLWFDTSANKMKVYNATGSSWDDVASVGQFFINTISSSSGTGGGSATFNGSAYRFTLSNPATGGAQQLLVSVNGVLQKPNGGSSQPSEGFAISGNDIIFSAAPASGSDYFIVTQGSSVSIGTPSANSVNSSHIIDGSIVNGDVSNSANIAGSKLADDSIPEVKLDVHNAPATGKYLKYTSNGMEWSDGASEGTDVKSTGESGTTKFLRTDGDGTSSWQVPPDTVYTHPNHSGEVTSSADGAQTIADDVVDEANLKISNAGSNGQFLSKQSGNTGGLTWADVSAAPEITGVADGTINAGKGVIVKSDGKLAQTSVTAAAWGSEGSAVGSAVSAAGAYPMAACYHADQGSFVIVYKNSSNGLSCQAGQISSGSTITWGSAQVLDTGTYNFFACDYDPVNKRVCVVGPNSGYHNYLKTFSVTITGTTVSSTIGEHYIDQGDSCDGSVSIRWIGTTSSGSFAVAFNMAQGGTQAYLRKVDLNTGNNQFEAQARYALFNAAMHCPDIAYDPDTNQFVVVFARTASNDIRSRLMVFNGNSFTINNTQTWNATGSHYQRIVYDKNANKFVLVYKDAGDSNKLNCRIGTVSGSSHSWGTETEVYSLGDYPSLTYVDNEELTVLTVKEDGGTDIIAKNITISGTDPVASSATTITSGGNAHLASTSDGTNAMVFWSGGSSHGKYAVKTGESTTLSAAAFVGFSSSTYTNGQTATVKVNSNVLTGQSSLTPATEYYVQMNGDIATTAAEPSVKAGVALTSTTLLIRQ